MEKKRHDDHKNYGTQYNFRGIKETNHHKYTYNTHTHTETVTDYNNITEPRRYQRHKAISFALETKFTYVQRQITNERIFAKFH